MLNTKFLTYLLSGVMKFKFKFDCSNPILDTCVVLSKMEYAAVNILTFVAEGMRHVVTIM